MLSHACLLSQHMLLGTRDSPSIYDAPPLIDAPFMPRGVMPRPLCPIYGSRIFRHGTVFHKTNLT